MNFEGQVMDIHTGFPVQGAEVRCYGPGGLYRGYSNEEGFFGFTGLDTGRWCLAIAKPPYAKQNCKCVLGGSDLFVNLFLEMETLVEEVNTG
jgi:hypothetical protein